MRKFSLPMIIALLFFSCQISFAGTCSNPAVAGDKDIWEQQTWMHQTSGRDEFAYFFNLQKDHWDESWGWTKYNDAGGYKWEFVKMMTSGFVMQYGMEDWLHYQGRWIGNDLILPTTVTGGSRSKISAVSRTKDEINIFYRDVQSKLSYKKLFYAPLDVDNTVPSEEYTNLSNQLATDKESYLITGDPVAVTRGNGSLDVFAISKNRTLLHFYWSEVAGWKVQDLTIGKVRPSRVNGSDRFFVYSNLHAVARNSQAIEVFAADNFNHLIHYYLDIDIWGADDLTVMFGDPFRIVDSLATSTREDGSFDVIGRDSNKNILHLNWSNTSGWTAENVSSLLNSGSPVRSDSGFGILSPTSYALFVYFRVGYDLHLATHFPAYGWFDLNVTGGQYPIEGTPSAVRRGNGFADAFVRDINGHIIQSSFSADALTISDTSLASSYVSSLPSIANEPVAIASGKDRLDVLGIDGGGRVIHYYWQKGEEWRAENTYSSTDVPITFAQSAGKMTVVRRGESWLDVLADRADINSRILYLYSAIGKALSPWHSSDDYSDWSSGHEHDFRYEPEDASGINGQAFRGNFTTDRIEMACGSFGSGRTPTFRASTMVHESTHMGYWPSDHQSISACSLPCADHWYSHGVGENSGRLGSSTRNHSPVQAQIEFLCDVAEFPTANLSINANDSARDEANGYMDVRILNTPPWRCGVPRPLH